MDVDVRPAVADRHAPGQWPTGRSHSTAQSRGVPIEEADERPVAGRDLDAEFTRFATAAHRHLARAAWSLTGDVHQTGELVQDALVRTYLAWPRACATDPTAYACRVLSNARIDQWRRRRRETLTAPEEMPEPPASGAPGELRGVEDRDEVLRALVGLSAQQRRVVVLRYLVGLSEREVAEVLGVTTGTVKTQTSRGLRRLRALLGSDGRGAPGRSS